MFTWNKVLLLIIHFVLITRTVSIMKWHMNKVYISSLYSVSCLKIVQGAMFVSFYLFFFFCMKNPYSEFWANGGSFTLWFWPIHCILLLFQAGLASLLKALKIHQGSYHSIALHFRPICLVSNCIKTKL